MMRRCPVMRIGFELYVGVSKSYTSIHSRILKGGRSHFASVDGLTSLPLCKVLQVLRKNGDSIVAVLEAFVHDPLIDWFAKRKKGGKNQRSWIKEREKKKQSRCLYICWLV